MPIVHVKGKVLPAIMVVNLQGVPSVHWEEINTGQVMDITTRIVNSSVDVEFQVNHYNDNNLGELLRRAWDLAQSAVDIYCFTSGDGLTVYLDTVVHDNGNVVSLLPKAPSLAAYCTAFDISPQNTGANNYDAMYRLVISEPPLMMALNDLIVSITLPHHAAVNCGRAIDGIRVMMTSIGLKRSQGWLILRQSLNVDEAYLSLITDTSTAPRHGDRTFIPGTIVTEVADRSWIVMNRFLEFRKRGNQPLPLAEFPLLAG
jgi:hypothetical protein